MSSPIIVIGNTVPCGTYLLRMHLSKNVELSFGRFKNAKLISLIVGDYIYIGSAMAQKGATSLAHRLIRHSTRTDNQPPHSIRADLITTLQSLNLLSEKYTPPTSKKLFWNIDHFLDYPAVSLQQIFMIRFAIPLETTLAEMLENDPHTIIFEKGLGANDSRGHTHLLRIESDERWWGNLPQRLSDLLSQS
jgi:Uri superfamily endonuclease